MKVHILTFKDNDIAQQYAQYAYDIWGEHLLQVMICENGWFDINLRAEDWAYPSFWLCQLNDNPKYTWQQSIIHDKRFTTDWKRHIEKCQEWIERWVPFYWPDRVSKYTKWIECRSYAKKYVYSLTKI